METRDRLFPYLTMDYKAAEAWLNAQAQQGWRVESFFFRQWGITLVSDDRPETRYCVDLYGGAKDKDYLELCRQAGWELVTTVRNMNIFCSLPGMNPAPIQTDPSLEQDRFERKYFWGYILAALITPLFLPLLLFAMGWFSKRPDYWTSIPIQIFSHWSATLLSLVLLFFLLLDFWQTLSMLLYFRRCRAATAVGSPIPIPKDRQARHRGQVQFLGVLVYLLIMLLRFFSLFTPDIQSYHDEERAQLHSQPIIMAEDLHITPEMYRCYFERRGTPLVQYIKFEDGTTVGLTIDSYRCYSELLAHWAVRTLYYDHARTYYPFEPVELGFDESWLYDNGEGYQRLLLRQGGVAVLLSGGVDWTAPDLQPALWERLELER